MDEDKTPETNVVVFPGANPAFDIPVDRVLKGAMEQNLSGIVIIGRKETGEWYNASSSGHIPSILWMLECAKSDLLRL